MKELLKVKNLVKSNPFWNISVSGDMWSPDYIL